MTRYPDWRTRLAAYLQDTARRPFRPGVHDCVLWAAGARAAMTGIDPMADWRGRYSTIEEGLRLALQHGCAEPWLQVVVDLEEVPPAYAQVGDLALLDGEDGVPALGVVQGAAIYVLHPRGTGTVPLTRSRRAWRV